MDLQKSLQQLEGFPMGEPNFTSGLVQRCHELCSVPLRELKAEDLRILIGQQIGLAHLVPLAIETLTQNPLEEGDLFPGSLLLNVIRAERSFWLTNSSLLTSVESLAKKALQLLGNEDQSLCEEIEMALRTMKSESY